MSANSKIEWTDRTWNPVTGCTEVSAGCDNCYAKRFAERFRGVPGHPFERGFDVTLRPERLQDPLRWRKPQRVFVNSMSDLFHRDVPDEFIAQVFGTMMRAKEHTFQVLTKRPERMRRFWPSVLAGKIEELRISARGEVSPDFAFVQASWPALFPDAKISASSFGGSFPPRNVWLGVSVEDERATWRIDMLRETPAAVRFLSCEPLIGPVDLRGKLEGISWVIVGGESGHGARPMHPWWVHDIRDACIDAGVAFFFKQWGEWKPICEIGESDDLYHPAPESDPEAIRRCKVQTEILQLDASLRFDFPKGAMQVFRLGKKAAGRELDGRTWDEYPSCPVRSAT